MCSEYSDTVTVEPGGAYEGLKAICCGNIIQAGQEVHWFYDENPCHHNEADCGPKRTTPLAVVKSMLGL